jgi:hypothetical protein
METYNREIFEKILTEEDDEIIEGKKHTALSGDEIENLGWSKGNANDRSVLKYKINGKEYYPIEIVNYMFGKKFKAKLQKLVDDYSKNFIDQD